MMDVLSEENGSRLLMFKGKLSRNAILEPMISNAYLPVSCWPRWLFPST